MEEDNLLNVYASKFINESGLRDVALYGKPKGDWKLRLVDFNSAKQAIFEWYYRDDLITTTYSYVSVLDDPNMLAFIKSMAKEMISQQKGDDTHDKVYGVNKQMCDLGKTLHDPMKPPSEEAIQEIVKALEITRKPKDIMEEKKTKKMTKAEAFEYLSNKKIDASINEREVQLKLFSLGVVWCTLDSNPTLGVYYLLIDEECHMTHCGCDLNYYKTHRYEEISADDILSIEIVEECAKDDEDPYFGGRIKDLQEMLEDDEVLIITKTNFLTMTK